jgi:hypothetical protein
MARTLYRVYLYTIALFLLAFAAGATVSFLMTVLSATPLRGYSSVVPPQTQLVQQAVFTVVAWLIAAGLGGLHYWLIRRDLQSDPGAAASPVRALYLNGAEAIAALIGTVALAQAANQLGQSYESDITGPVAAGVVAFAVFALLEAERRRAPAPRGGALVLQRVHFYVWQLLLVFIATPYWLGATNQTVQRLASGLLPANVDCPRSPPRSAPPCPIVHFTPPPVNLAWLWGAAAVVSAIVVLYGVLSRRDSHSALRHVIAFVGLGYGVSVLLVGFMQAAQLVLQVALGVSGDPYSTVNTVATFVGAVVFGLAVVVFFAAWLAHDAALGAMEPHVMGLAVLAVTTGLLAVPFWVGCGMLLYYLVDYVSPGGQIITPTMWADAGGTLVTGLAYIPFGLRLRQRAHRAPNPTPRRGLVLALLALGMVATAVGLASFVYAIVTAALGAPLTNWQETARSAGVTLLIGAVLTAIYVGRGRAEGWLWRGQRVEYPAAEGVAVPAGVVSPATAPTVESVLDDVLAGRITRDEAAAHLRKMLQPPSQSGGA